MAYHIPVCRSLIHLAPVMDMDHEQEINFFIYATEILVVLINTEQLSLHKTMQHIYYTSVNYLLYATDSADCDIASHKLYHLILKTEDVLFIYNKQQRQRGPER